MSKRGTFLYVKDETDRGEEKRITGTDLNSVRHLNIASKLLDENGNYITDSINNAIIQMEYEHHEVHEGNLYQLNVYSTVENGTPKLCRFTTGAKYVHLKQKKIRNGTDTLLCTFLEEPDIATPGTTEVPSLNRNRNSSNTATMKVYSDVAGVTNGTVLEYDYLSGTNQSAGFPGETEIEWILKPNTDYVYKLENLTAGEATFLGVLLWYEKS